MNDTNQDLRSTTDTFNTTLIEPASNHLTQETSCQEAMDFQGDLYQKMGVEVNERKHRLLMVKSSIKKPKENWILLQTCDEECISAGIRT